MTPAKRALDIVISLVLGLILLGPLILLIAVMWLREGGPIF